MELRTLLLMGAATGRFISDNIGNENSTQTPANTSNSDRNLHNGDNSLDEGQDKRKRVMVVGDSIVKFVLDHKLSSVEAKVTVHPQSGSTVEDLEDYIKPIIRKKPDEIILHVGTNDLASQQGAVEIAGNIASLGKTVSRAGIKVTISSITARNRKHEDHLKDKLTRVNDSLKRIASENRFGFIDNSNIDPSCLNRSYLHLNPTGTKKLIDNFKGDLYSNN